MSICDYGQEKFRPQTSPKGEQSKQLSENSERPPEVTHSGYAGPYSYRLQRLDSQTLILPLIAWLQDSYLMLVQ